MGKDVKGFTMVAHPSLTDHAHYNGLAQQGGVRVRGESTRVSLSLSSFLFFLGFELCPFKLLYFNVGLLISSLV